MSNIDIIYFTLFPWDHPYSSVSLSFTREFAKNNRVFYVNPPFTYKDFIKNYSSEAIQSRRGDLLRGKMRYEKIPNVSDNVIAVQPPMIMPINFLPKGSLYDTLHRWDNEIVFKTIQQVVEDYKLDNYIYLNCFNPFVGGVLPVSFKPLLNIYQCIDDMEQEVYTAKHWAKLEEKVIADADIAFVTSRQLRNLKLPFNRNTYVLHNAVDATIFERSISETHPRPAEIAQVTTPIIGFTGNMDASRMDYKLLKSISEAHPDKTLVLVGPINSNEFYELGLDKQPNVITTGSKNINDLPKYLQHFDCTIIPFLCNTLTESIYPLKINEYLFSGKPVISTSFSVDIRSFGDVIYLAKDHADFNNLINQAIVEDNLQRKEARIAVARTNTWEHRVKEFWQVVEKHLVLA